MFRVMRTLQNITRAVGWLPEADLGDLGQAMSVLEIEDQLSVVNSHHVTQSHIHHVTQSPISTSGLCKACQV